MDHDRIICVKCGRVEEFNDPRIEDGHRDFVHSMGYGITDHTLVLYGYCLNCDVPNEQQRPAHKPALASPANRRNEPGQ